MACSMRLFSVVLVLVTLLIVTEMAPMAVEGKKQDRDSHEAKKKLHQMKQSDTAKNHEAKHKSKTNKNKCDEHVQSQVQSHCIPDTNSAGDCRSSCKASGFYDADCIDDKCMCIKKIC